MTDTRQKVVERHLKGHTNGQIANALGLSRGTVGGHLYRWRQSLLRKPVVQPKPHWTDEEKAALFLMHKAGHTSAEVGAALGKSSEAVRKQGKRQGLSWADRCPRSALTYTVPALTDAQIEENQRENDVRFMRALALAYQRGEFPKECYPSEAA